MKKTKQNMLMGYLSIALAVVSAFVFMMAAVPGTKAMAATQKASYTFYVGQANYFTNFEDVKSVKSSNSAIVKAKKDSKSSYKTNLTAKKAGKAVVTIKTKRGNTVKLSITVVKPNLSAEIVSVSEDTGRVIVKVTNKSKLTYENTRIQYTFKNTDGEEVETSSASAAAILPKSSTYAAISYNKSAYNVDKDLSSVSVITKGGYAPDYSPNRKYSNGNSKLAVSEGDEEEGKIPVTFKNTSGSSLYGNVVYVFYNEEGSIIDITSKYVYVKAKETDTSSLYTPYHGYDHYDKVVNVYSYKNK